MRFAQEAHVDELLLAQVVHPVLVGGVGVLVGHADARADAELDELALEDLAADLVAEVLLVEAAAAHLGHDVGGGDGAALLLLGLGGDVGDAAVDLFRRDVDVGLVGLLLLEALVDHRARAAPCTSPALAR